MPVYNSEKYVAQAIESVLTQDFEDFELLVVDDGSIDASGAICDEIALRDNRCKVFHIPNGGMCHARNMAINKAAGDYILFCDNDDKYLPGCFTSLDQRIAETECDCYVYGRRYSKLDDAGEIIAQSDMVPKMNVTYKGEGIFEHFGMWCACSAGVWARAYKREFLLKNKILFNESLRNGAEDSLFNIEVLSLLESVGYINQVFYVWSQRLSHSTSMNLNDNYVEGIKLLTNAEYHLMKVKHINIINPPLFSQRLLSSMVYSLTTAVDATNYSYTKAKKLYHQLYEIYQPYFDEINPALLPKATAITFRCLKAKQWRLLHWLTFYGTKVRRKLNLNIPL